MGNSTEWEHNSTEWEYNSTNPATNPATAPTNPATTPTNLATAITTAVETTTAGKSGGTGGTAPVASSGLIIRSPNAAIKLGPQGDVALVRSKPSVLSISAEQLVINGAVDAQEVLINVDQVGDVTIKQYIQRMVLKILKEKQDKKDS